MTQARIDIRIYRDVQIYYEGYSFRATVGEREVQAESESVLHGKIDAALNANRADVREKVQVPAILVQGDNEPILGTFRGLHAKHGTVLFRSAATGKMVEVEEYQPVYLFPAGTALAEVAAAAKAVTAAKLEALERGKRHREALIAAGAKTAQVVRAHNHEAILNMEAEIRDRLAKAAK